MGYSKKVKTEILEKGLELYKEDPAKLNHHSLAKALNISNAKIHYHFGSDLKNSVLKHAVETGDSIVIAHLLAANHSLVSEISETERQKHLDIVYG